jgi:predicted metallopeptidase
MALQQSPEYKEIAEKILDKFPVAFGHIELDKVLFLKETEKAPKKYADTRAVKSPYSFLTELKFIITVYEPMVVSFSEAQLNMLIFHELLHIDVDFQKLKKHNIEDFRELISAYGINWDIDPNLPNILDDDTTVPVIVQDEEDEDEPELS